MTKKLKLVMATNNAGKLREARAIAGDRLEILSLDDIGYHHDIPETADTLEGNALQKVRAIREACGLDCFADDTGLLVDALDGAPGVYTARYAGEGCTPDDNIALMLKNMDGKENRKARFRTSIALSLNGEEHLFEGSAEGSIATERSGSHGFGYDPIFVCAETGKCFADMTDDEKNAVSHRGRAISAMMKWLATLCVAFLAILPSGAQVSTDWSHYNTFDDKIDNVYDTPSKTYFVVQGQYQRLDVPDNKEKLCFLYCLDKASGEIRPYGAQNFLSGTLIRCANYNARKNYLMIVYNDKTIDFLYDDGKTVTNLDLKNYYTIGSKEVRSISFDQALDRAYLTTDFGFIIVDDKKNEIVTSGVYETPIDKAVRVADEFIILRDGKLYSDAVDAPHISLSEFKTPVWAPEGTATDIYSLSSSKLLVQTNLNNQLRDYVVTFPADGSAPVSEYIGNLQGGTIAENKNGLFIARYGMFVNMDRETAERTTYTRRTEDFDIVGGSWDMKDFYLAKSREGFYSVRRDGENWTVTREIARPNSPATFRSTSMLYTPRHGMLVNTHGLDQNFSSNNAKNPILLSGLKDGSWDMYGMPYVAPEYTERLCNPCGIAQDPDNPDIFYFGSVLNGVIRYNIKDGSSLLHMTSTTDAPSLPGHVSVAEPYGWWGTAFMVMNPKFDTRGNLWVAHTDTKEAKGIPYTAEIWAWPAENRKASTSPETFQPFIRFKINPTVRPNKIGMVLPLTGSATKDMVIYFPIDIYDQPFVVFDHNGTLEIETDDRQVVMKDLEDSDGKVTCHHFYCAVEDPETGLVWIGTDNGVLTLDPKEAFDNPGKISRIKVSRNDGTSLADYLLSGIGINNISIDNRGRKWFSLQSGGLVCTSPDGKTILDELTTENSMLPSDEVYASCYNPESHSMMIATSVGLCQYYIPSQSDAVVTPEVRIFPNPVRHDYYGWVTIDGLEEDCIVKITDAAGNLVRELGPASDGRIQWDICGFNLERVPSGVYFVLASSGPNGTGFNEAGKILVVNR